MAKWRRGGGGRRGGRWVIEYVPKPEPITPEVKRTPDPFEYEDPYQIRNALAAMESNRMDEEQLIAWCQMQADHVKMGPGHVVVDDFNWHMIDWCIERNADAIRNNLAGVPDDYAGWDLMQLAESLSVLRLLKATIEGSAIADG